MTWIRRNWPDLLIVLFILALIAGFVVVLMGGAGSLFGNRNSSPSSVVETSTPSSTPSAKPTTAAPAQDPVAAAPGTEPAPTAPVTAKPDTTQPFPTPEPNSSTSAPATATGSTPTDSVKPDAIPVIPAQTAKPSSSATGSSTPEAKPAAATPTVETVPVRPAPRVETTPVQPVVKPTVETAPAQSAPRVETAPVQPAARPTVRTPRVQSPRVQASGSGIPTKSDYRISAGLYSSSAAADEVASKIRGLGYPVHVVPSKDDTEVVLVGPFGNRRDANAASGDISRVHQNLFVYAPSSDSTSGSASSSGNSNTSSNTPTASDSNSSTPATTPKVDSGSSTPSSGNTASDTPASGTLYLQVGAFGSQSSADTLIEKLRSSGYSPRTRIGSSGLVRVVVGPFAAAEIDGAKSKLSSEGVDSFTVRSN